MASTDLHLLLIGEELTLPGYTRFEAMTGTVASDYNIGSFSHEEQCQVTEQYGVRDYFIQPKGIIFPHRPSMALVDLATVVAQSGYGVCIIDNFLRYKWREEQARKLISEYSPKVIGITTTFVMSQAAVEHLVRKVRQIAPASKIVIGGPTARRLSALHSCADYCVIGAGEQPMLDILEAAYKGRDPKTIPFIAFKRPDGTVGYGPSAKESALVGIVGQPFRARPTEEIPIADWSLYPRGRNNVYAIEFSRGCKYNCSYCSYDRGKITRSLENIKTELIQNAKLGIFKYRISDSNFTDGPPQRLKYPEEVCNLMIDLDLGLEWSCYSRVDDLTDNLAERMRKAGCFAVFFGIESGDDEILRLMHKGHDAAEAREGVRIAQRNGLFAHANFLCGYPGETKNSFDNTLDFIEHCKPDSVAIAKFFVEQHVPVRGKAMESYHLEGYATKWKHTTMDSQKADGLIAKGVERLRRQGIVMGNEYEFAALKSLGMTTTEIKELFATRTSTGSIGPENKNHLRGLYLNQMPKAIAEDQKMMASAV
jgi:radical SAM superfamily enzyme YgiQ (UPF0313 family)